MTVQTYSVEGMTCGHCVAGVKKALDAIDGVRAADVRIGAATVEFDPAVAPAGRITDAIRDAGYTVVSAG